MIFIYDIFKIFIGFVLGIYFERWNESRNDKKWSKKALLSILHDSFIDSKLSFLLFLVECLYSVEIWKTVKRCLKKLKSVCSNSRGSGTGSSFTHRKTYRWLFQQNLLSSWSIFYGRVLRPPALT